MKYSLFLGLACVLGLAGCAAGTEDAFIATPESMSGSVMLAETGPDVSCRVDAHCWCRNFTGAEFVEGRVPSHCCTRTVMKDGTVGGCVDAERSNYCAQCVYR